MEKILEFCGFKYSHNSVTGDKVWHYPNENRAGVIVLDMNFFFKYVVPKVEVYWIEATNDGHFFSIYARNGVFLSAVNIDPNKAWQEALLKLMVTSG